MKSILLFIFSTACFLSTYAQELHYIKGNVTDENHKPLPYVAVTLSDPDSILIKGAVTDSTGHFTFNNIERGKYIFTAKSMGFEDFSNPIVMEGKDIDMPDILLRTSNFLLDEVEVKGREFIRKEDFMLIIPGKQQSKHATTGYDLLDNLMIPGLDVDKQSGIVKNFNGLVTLYINGRKADFREVKSLRSKDIEKIEYHDAPKGIYAGEIAAINYIIKEYKTGGYLSVDGRQSIGYLNGDYNAIAKMSRGSTTYKFFGGHSMRKVDSTVKELETLNFHDYNITRNKSGNRATTKTNNQYARFDVENSTKKRTLSGKLTLAHSNSPLNFLEENIIYGGRYAGKESSAYIENTQSGWMPNLDLMGKFSIKSNQMFIAYLNTSYSHNNYNRIYRETGFNSATDANEDFYKGLANFMYYIGMKHNNSLSIQLSHLYQNSRSNYTGDYNNKQQLWSAESFFYTSYNQRINQKLSLYAHAGFSMLQYKLLGKDRVDRIGPRLNGRLTIQPKQNQFIQVSFDITSTYPTLDRLNDVELDIDPFIIKRGNPDMDNSIFYQGNAGYNAQFGPINIMVAAFCFYSTNTVAEHYYTDQEKLISSYSSHAGFLLTNMMAEITWKATNNLNIKAKGQWVHSRISKLTHKDHTTWMGSLTMNYYLKDWKFNLFTNLPYKIVDTSLLRKEFKYKTNYGASISWNHGGWSAEIGTNNPFSKNWSITTGLDTEAYQYEQIRYDKSLQQTGYISLSYTFDFGKKTDREKNDTNTNINSAILKAY